MNRPELEGELCVTRNYESQFIKIKLNLAEGAIFPLLNRNERFTKLFRNGLKNRTEEEQLILCF